MSLKDELVNWARAVEAYDEQDFEKSLEIFEQVPETSKICTNTGLVYAAIGEHEVAVKHFRKATALDQYHALAYFQCGVSNFLLGCYEEACQDFDQAFRSFRGCPFIDYEKIGLDFCVYPAEVLYNKGLCSIYMGRIDKGLQDMYEAQRVKATEEHQVIDDAIQDRGKDYTVFSIPVGILYRPPAAKLKNAQPRDYLGRAQLIAASDANDRFTTFSGVTRLQQGLTPSGAPIAGGQSVSQLSRAVTAAARIETAPLPKAPGPPKATTALQKSATIGSGSIARNPSMGGGLGSPGPGLSRNPSTAQGLSRGPSRAALSRNTSASGSSTALGGPGLGGGGPLPVRGLSVRRPGTTDSAQSQGPPRLPAMPSGGEPFMSLQRSPEGYFSGERERDPRVGRGNRENKREETRDAEYDPSAFYDDYLGAYEDPALLKPDNVATWAAKTKGAPPPPSVATLSPGRVSDGYNRSYSRGYDRHYDDRPRAPPSTYSGSTMTVRRNLSRRPTRGYEEEEGYGSEDYSDAPFELTKIRIKLHYKDDVRGMAISPNMKFDEFLGKVSAKFGRPFGTLGLKFKDEDGGKISMRDDSDYELAIELARESARGRSEGKLEIWCVDE